VHKHPKKDERHILQIVSSWKCRWNG